MNRLLKRVSTVIAISIIGLMIPAGLMVAAANPMAMTIASSANPSVYGQTVIFTVSGLPQALSGLNEEVTFSDNGVNIGTGTINNGTASLSTAFLPAGPNIITADYAGDTNFPAEVAEDPTTNQLYLAQEVDMYMTSSANPSTLGSPVTFTVNGLPLLLNGELVVFKDGDTPIGTGIVCNGSASLQTNMLPMGENPVTAYCYVMVKDVVAYSFESNTIVQDVRADFPISLSSTLNPSTYGDSVTFNATGFPAETNGQTVKFMDGTTNLTPTPVMIVSGAASFTTSSLSAASHSITVVYAGDTDYNPASSSIVTQVVNKASVTVTLASSLNPSPFGSSVTFTASGLPNVSGESVIFMDGTTAIGTGMISGGKATFSTNTLAVGSHNITAVYSGDANYMNDTSAILAQVVNKTNVIIVLSVNNGTIASGGSVTLTATGIPMDGLTESVQFMDGSTPIGSPVTASNGTAVLVTTTLPLGDNSITVDYPGDTNYNTTVSNVEVVTVDQSTTINNSTTPTGSASNPQTGDPTDRKSVV